MEGALVFTSDSKHVGIHKLFYAALSIRKKFVDQKIDCNICHAMIVIGWDEKKRRPLLAHSVMDGVRINTVDYFKPIKYCYLNYKTADKLIVYIPTDMLLRKEIAKNAKLSARISTNKKIDLGFLGLILRVVSLKNKFTRIHNQSPLNSHI